MLLVRQQEGQAAWVGLTLILKYWKKFLMSMQVLTYIFNLFFTTGLLPDLLKIAKVVPIYRNRETDLPGNYRPISFPQNIRNINGQKIIWFPW